MAYSLSIAGYVWRNRSHAAEKIPEWLPILTRIFNIGTTRLSITVEVRIQALVAIPEEQMIALIASRRDHGWGGGRDLPGESASEFVYRLDPPLRKQDTESSGTADADGQSSGQVRQIERRRGQSALGLHQYWLSRVRWGETLRGCAVDWADRGSKVPWGPHPHRTVPGIPRTPHHRIH